VLPGANLRCKVPAVSVWQVICCYSATLCNATQFQQDTHLNAATILNLWYLSLLRRWQRCSRSSSRSSSSPLRHRLSQQSSRSEPVRSYLMRLSVCFEHLGSPAPLWVNRAVFACVFKPSCSIIHAQARPTQRRIPATACFALAGFLVVPSVPRVCAKAGLSTSSSRSSNSRNIRFLLMSRCCKATEHPRFDG